MKTCGICERQFPTALINTLVLGHPEHGEQRTPSCPICALKIRNQSAGLPLDTPFKGKLALELHRRAVDYLKKRETNGTGH